MEPEGSLPHSQQPATCPYPVPDIYLYWTGIKLYKSDFSIKYDLQDGLKHCTPLSL